MTRVAPDRHTGMDTDLMPAARALGALVTDLDDTDLARPTPCTGWAVADLLEHLGVVAAGFTTLATGSDAPAGRATLAGALEHMAATWRDPAAWRGTAGPPELPRATWGRIGLTELVVHTWDLARALDRPLPALPDDLLRVTLEHVLVFVPQAPLPELWGTPVTLLGTAPLWDRVVAGTGRAP